MLKRKLFKKRGTYVNRNMIKINFLITGTCGAGKTTLVQELKKRQLNNFIVYDFDDCGVPDGADVTWRKKATRNWLKTLKESNSKGFHTILCGGSVPPEVLECPEYEESLNIHFGFIKASDALVKERLQERNWDIKQIEDNINWAICLERFVKIQPNHFLLDSTVNTPEQVADSALDYINKVCSNPLILSSEIED